MTRPPGTPTPSRIPAPPPSENVRPVSSGETWNAPSISSELVPLALLSLFFMKVVAGHASERANRVSVIRVPGDVKVVKAQLGADGTIHLLLDAENGPRYVKSTDSGVTFSAPMTIVDAASQKPGLEFQGEDLAVGKESRGKVHPAQLHGGG